MRLELRILTGLAVAVLFLSPAGAHAMSRDAKSVMHAAKYGLIGGTLAGLATYPMTKEIRAIFIGTSVGLYLGIAVGIYHIYHRDDPENPLNAELEEESSRDPILLARERPGERERPQVEARWPIARF